MITVIIVVYKSDKKKLKKILDKIDESIKVIIIDNSLNYDFGGLNLSKNAQVIRSSNIGNGAGINKALEICQTNYALYMDIDVKLPNNFIYEFISFIKKLMILLFWFQITRVLKYLIELLKNMMVKPP